MNIMSITRFDKFYSDYIIAFGIVSLARLVVDDKILYHKRDDRITDSEDYPKPIIIKNINNGVFSINKLLIASFYYFKHVNNLALYLLLFIIILYRIPKSLIVSVAKYLNYFRHINKQKIKRKLFEYYAKLFLKPYLYEKIRREKMDIGFGYATVSSKIIMPINQLHVKINKNSGKEKISIFDSPHYSHISNYLNNINSNQTNTINNYRNYKKKYFPELNIKEQESSFEELAKCIKTEYEQHSMDIFILVNKDVSFFQKQYSTTIVDGTHRLSILAALGVEKVICKIVDKIEEYND